MKKILIVGTLVLLLSILFVGCSLDKDIENNVDATNNYNENLDETNNDSNNDLEETRLEDGDGNPYTYGYMNGDTLSYWYDYSEAYEKLDLSKYSAYGAFGFDGLMWVEMSDYTGKKFAYIDYNGDVIIDFPAEIAGCGNFENGLALFYYELDIMGNGYCGIIDTKGNVLNRFEKKSATEIIRLNNGNIYFTYIIPKDVYVEVYDGNATETYMYCKGKNEFVEMPEVNNDIGDYSEGLLRVSHSGFDYEFDWLINLDGKATCYYDENGNISLILERSNEYYKEILSADDFYNGRARIVFVGMDDNYYEVYIDKKLDWVTEPQQVSDY